MQFTRPLQQRAGFRRDLQARAQNATRVRQSRTANHFARHRSRWLRSTNLHIPTLNCFSDNTTRNNNISESRWNVPLIFARGRGSVVVRPVANPAGLDSPPQTLTLRLNGLANQRRNERAGGNGRSPRKPADKPSGTIPICKNMGVKRPGIEPGSPWWEIIQDRLEVSMAYLLRHETPVLLLPLVSTHRNPVGPRHTGHAYRIWLDYSPPNKANRVQFPAGSFSDIRTWESCRTIPLAGGFSWGSHPNQNYSFHSGAAPNSPRFTLIGSQDLDVKSRLNFFIPHSASLPLPSTLYTKNVCSVVVTQLESRRATSCGYNSSHPVWHALYDCLQDIHMDSSPFLLQPFHEALTRRSNSSQRCSIGLRSELWAGQSNRRTLLSAYHCIVALETWHLSLSSWNSFVSDGKLACYLSENRVAGRLVKSKPSRRRPVVGVDVAEYQARRRAPQFPTPRQWIFIIQVNCGGLLAPRGGMGLVGSRAPQRSWRRGTRGCVGSVGYQTAALFTCKLDDVTLRQPSCPPVAPSSSRGDVRKTNYLSGVRATRGWLQRDVVKEISDRRLQEERCCELTDPWGLPTSQIKLGAGIRMEQRRNLKKGGEIPEKTRRPAASSGTIPTCNEY
ncbi:hypothetical protein PR048_027127 [Dryococelus australis]|uniref:Uncharacterized protein n=1 Tax=Dryococelus australis TaxID=614101 RepID=A0ABQ9GEU7_9NEOP|nr:hypothetical protein PR048_027127 [Dryococelus australis]